MNKTKSKLYFFFSLIGTLLLSACGVRNHHGFVGEDARFANYTFLGTDGDGSAGLAYYADETNPNQIAVSIGTCTATDIVVTTYDSKPVTSVFPSGFQNCDTIQTITLPDSVTMFGTDAFAGSSLQSITIPKNLEVIASGSFRNCKSLDTVRFKKNNLLNTINDYAFANCYTLATFPFHEIENLRTIGKEAFLYCIELTSIVFPDRFTTLESYAFQDCKSLTTIYFPASTAYVAANAFRGVGHSARIYFSQSEPGSESSSSSASASSSITPMSLAEDFNFSYGDYYIPVAYGVGQMKFDDNYPYFQFLTPDNGDYPLYECTTGDSEGDWSATATIEYPEHIAKNEVLLMTYTGSGIQNMDIPSTILSGAFKVVGIMKDVFKGKTDIKKVTFHENLRFIDYCAFSNCTQLTNIDLSGAVDLKYIQSRAFFNTIPSNGNSTGVYYSLHIPSNVENIAADAFRSCDGLFRLYFDGATNEYEESFVCGANGNFSFDLAYQPLSISSVTFDGPTVAYTVQNGKTIKLTNCRKSGVAKVKYTTNSTTTQTFTGHKDEENVLVSEFVLASKTDSSSIGSVTVGGSPAAYTISDYDSKSKITFATAPAEGAEIVVTYRGQSKLEKIGPYAFYGCSPSFATKKPTGPELRQTDNPFSNIYFPTSLRSIGVKAFASGQFIGGVTFQSQSLIISEYAFSEQKTLSSIVFPTSVSSLSLGTKCFSCGLKIEKKDAEAAAGNLYKKLISVTLPANTTVNGNYIFNKHIFVAIYCIGKEPNGADSFKQWNYVNDTASTLELFGSFSSDAQKLEMDYAPVYVVSSAADIITLPSKDHPIFDFVKQVDDNEHEYAVLANYHYYGGRIKDQDGDAAIIMGTTSANTDLTTNNRDYINSNYDSEYAVMLPNGHFRFEIPYKVLIGGSLLDVEEIGKSALALQINNSTMHPRGDDPGTSGMPNPKTNSVKYWEEGENFWTMREINLPNSVKTISEIAMAFVPFTTLKSYGPGTDNSSLKASADGFSMIWNHADDSDDLIGMFPRSLVTLGKKACVYSAIGSAKLPSCLEVFGDVTSAGPNMTHAYDHFPFMGCFELATLEIYSVGTANPVFAGKAGSGVISMASDGKMLEGAGAKLSITIPWGTREMVSGAFRGGRKIQHIVFPYTLGKISNHFLDTIGNGRDLLGRSGQSDLQTVHFGGLAAEYAASASDPGDFTPTVPQCTKIEQSAFYGASSLTTFEFPVGLTETGKWSFINCSSLNLISVDKGESEGATTPSSHLNFADLPSLTTIGEECFKNCSGITQITTSSALAKLGKGNFTGCTGLTSLNLNSATWSIGTNCFSGCKNLPSVSFNTAAGNTLESSCFSGCTNLTSITFNGTKNTIGSSSFSSCTSLETITFSVPQNNTSFANNAFEKCTSLKTVVIPTGVTVNKNVFKGCTGLDDNVNTGGGVIVGAGVKFTGGGTDSAFIDCGADTRIFLGDTQAQYESGSARYAGGWNYCSYNNGSGDPLRFYLYAETDPGVNNQSWGYWHWLNGVEGGTPVVWREKGPAS